MQTVELRVQVEKSQLAQLEAQVNKLDGKKIDLKVNVQGLQGINKEMTNFVNAMARYQGASAKIASANAKLKTSENQLAVAQQKTAQTANKKAEAHSKLLTQMQRTQTAERNLQTQIQKTNTERQRSITQAGRVRAEEVRLQQQMERTRRAQEQNTRGAQAYGESMQKAGKEVSGLQRLMGGSLGEIAGRMFMWQAMGEAVSIPIRAMKEAIDTMKAVDDEMVEIRKVTDFNKQQLKELEDQAYKTASAYGETADSYLQNVAAYARAGYQEQSSAMAELSTKTQIVADTTADIANQFLLSTDAAYHYNGSIAELTKVLDGANEIENNNATSIEKIAEGLGLVAPISAQARMGVDELTAAIGTITAVTQRSGAESARAMRALILNILGDTQTEVEEGVTLTTEQINNMKDVLKQYAPEALKAAEATGEVINPMKAIEGLAKAFQDGVISEQKLMEIVTDIGGKLRSSQLLALIQNWDMYEKMLDEYRNAAGSADREVENAMDSWTRKTNVLKNNWTEFVNNLVDSEAIKTGIDGISSIFSGLNDAFEAAKKEGDFFENLFAISDKNYLDRETEKVKRLQNEYETLTGAGSEYAQLMQKSSDGELTQQEERRLALLKAQAQVMQDQIKIGQQELYQSFQKTQGADTNKRIDRKTGQTITIEEEVSKDIEATKKLTEAQDKLYEKFKRGGSNIQEYRDGLAKLITDNEDLYNTLSQFDSWGFDLSDAQQEFLDFYNWMLDSVNMSDEDLKVSIALEGLEDAGAGLTEFAGKSVADGAKIRKALEEVGASAETIQSVMDALAADGNIILDVEANGAEETISQLEELGIAIETENGKQINIDGLDQLATQLGMNRTKATELVSALGMIDGVTFTNAKGEIVSVEQAIDSLKTKSAVDIFIDAKDQATKKLKDVQNLAEIVGKLKKTVTVNAQDNASGPIAKIRSALNALKDRTINVRTNNITTNTTVTVPGNSSGSTGGKGVRGRYTVNAEGTRNYKGGPTLLGDELSPDGSPRPELVIRRSGDAFIAGVNGPVATTLPAGARIFNYRETMDILSGRDILEIPAYANAQGGGGGGAKGKSLTQSWKAGAQKLASSQTSSSSSVSSKSSASGKSSASSGGAKTSGGTKSSGVSSSSGSSQSKSSSKSGGSSKSSGSSSGGSDTDEYLESLKKQLEVLEAQYSFLEASNAETGDMIAKSQEIQGQLHTINDYLRATGGEEKEIWDNSAKWHQELQKIREEKQQVYQKERALLESEVDLYDKQGRAATDTVAKLKAIQETLHKEAEYLRSIKADQKDINDLSIEWWEIQEKIHATQRAIYEDERDLLTTEVELYEKQGRSVSERIAKLKEVQKNLHKEAEYLRSIKASQAEINELSIEWWNIQDQILSIQRDLVSELDSAIAKELRKAQEQRDAEISLIDKQIEKLREARDIQQDQLDLEEKQKSVEEARYAMRNAENERTIRYFNKQKNQWEWGADPQQVKSAQENYENARKDMKDYLAERAFEAQIKALEDQKESINRQYETLEARWNRVSEAFEEPLRDIKDILRDLLATGTLTGEQVQVVRELVGDIKGFTGEIVQYAKGTRTEAVGKAQDGSVYNIGSQKGLDFLDSAPAGATMTGGDGSIWTKNTDGSTTIYKNGKTYTVSGATKQYDIGSEKGLDFVHNAPPGATMVGGDGSTWTKNPDGTTTISKNGNVYKVDGGWTTTQQRTGYAEDGSPYHIASEKGLNFLNNASYGETMTGGDGSFWQKLPNGATTITKNGKTYTVYDNGGVISGIGGIKRSGGDEMVLPPALTAAMLSPVADQRFRERMTELSYIYGTGTVPYANMLHRSTSSQDHYGDIYTFGNVTLTEDKAKATTVYELAQMSRGLIIYKNN